MGALRRITYVAVLLVLIAIGSQASEITIPNIFSSGTPISSSEVNQNFNTVEVGVNDNAQQLAGVEQWHAVEYASGSTTGGIQEAYDACIAGSGGEVVIPRGRTAINASGVQSPILTFEGGDTTDAGGDKVGFCTVVGYGSGDPINNRSGETQDNGPSEIAISNLDACVKADGRCVGILVDNAPGIGIRHFALKPGMGSVDDPTDVGIWIRNSGGFRMDDVVMRDATAVPTGTGIELSNSQKSSIGQSWVSDFDYGIVIDDSIAGTVNATTIDNTSIRDADIRGLSIEGIDGCGAGGQIRISGSVIEGGLGDGIGYDNDATCTVVADSLHFEQGDGTGNSSVRLQSTGARFLMYGGRFGGNPDFSIVRTVTQASTTGPDAIYGGRFFANAGDVSITAGEVLCYDCGFLAGPDLTALTFIEGGNVIQGTSGTSECAQFDANGNLEGTGSLCGSGGSGGTTSVGGFTYVINQTDDFVVGGTTPGNGAWYVDESTGDTVCTIPGCAIITERDVVGDQALLYAGSGDSTGGVFLGLEAPDTVTSADDVVFQLPDGGCSANQVWKVQSVDTSGSPDIVVMACSTDEGGAPVLTGTATLGTSPISANSCATPVTVSATGVATTDVIDWTPNADIEGVDGYGVGATGDGLVIYPYPTANNVNFKVCNATDAEITPGAVTLNWKVQ